MSMHQPDYRSLELSPDDILEMKQRSLRISKLESAINQALQQLEPEFIKKLDEILQSLGVAPSISGEGSWLVPVSSYNRRGLPVQYLKSSGDGWRYGFINLSIKLEVHDLIYLLEDKVKVFFSHNSESAKKEDLRNFLRDLSDTISSHAYYSGNPCQELQPVHTQVYELNANLTKSKSVIIEGKEFQLIQEAVCTSLGEIGVKFSNLASSSTTFNDSPLEDIRQSLDLQS